MGRNNKGGLKGAVKPSANSKLAVKPSDGSKKSSKAPDKITLNVGGSKKASLKAVLMDEDDNTSNIDSIAEDEFMESEPEPFEEESQSDAGDFSVKPYALDSESEAFANQFKANIISLVGKAKDEETKELMKRKIALVKERIQSR